MRKSYQQKLGVRCCRTRTGPLRVAAPSPSNLFWALVWAATDRRTTTTTISSSRIGSERQAKGRKNLYSLRIGGEDAQQPYYSRAKKIHHRHHHHNIHNNTNTVSLASLAVVSPLEHRPRQTPLRAHDCAVLVAAGSAGDDPPPPRRTGPPALHSQIHPPGKHSPRHACRRRSPPLLGMRRLH